MQSTGENATILPSMNTLPPTWQNTPFAAAWPAAGTINAYGMTPASYPVKPNKGRRYWLLIAAAALLVVASLLGAFFFAFPPKPTTTTPGLSLNVPTTGITQGGNTPSGLSPIATGTPNHTAFTHVSTPTSKQTPGVTVTTTQGVTATPTNAATATATATPDPTPDPSPTADPTTTPITETVVAAFTSGPYAVTTTYSYSGTVSITVSGEGQASQTQYSDALYVYTDNNGNAVTPKHSSCWVLYIDDKPVDDFTSSIPAYQSSHSYSFTINAPGGTLTFGVCDSMTSDNTGSYTITVTQQ